MIFDTTRSSANAVEMAHVADPAGSPHGHRTFDSQQPDWSVVRETDFSGVLSEWSSAAKSARTTRLSADLDRALAYAG